MRGCYCFLAIILVWLGANQDSALAAKRAFVVGNQLYLPALLGTANSDVDAGDFSREVKGYGYIVDSGGPHLDLTREMFEKKWSDFLKTINSGDQVIIYYSGHGTEIGSTNYIVPIVTVAEFAASKTNPDKVFISVPDLVATLNAKSPGTVVWLLDACRNAENAVTGLKNRPELGTAFFFYSSDSAHASQGFVGDRNSAFTRSLIYAMAMYPRTPLNIVAKIIQRRVRNYVLAKNLKLVPSGTVRQNPAFYDSLPAPWCFGTCVSGQLIEINYFSGKRPVNETDANSFRKSLPDRVKQLNAVFIGRETALSGDCNSKNPEKPDLHPFGCNVLQDFSNGNVDGLIGRRITSGTATNVHRQIPVLSGSRVRGPCIPRIIPQGESATITGTVELVYAGEIFYWATIETSQDCPQASSSTQAVSR
jgi:Caspase domain